ncbi:MAG: putative diguanylate cyclase YegE [Syntrophus sp. PtaU1.Bin208]|nr:MAG: putative diguanylate cyclase YegE [Syntrophus sp. PtaU1.Bin208]
MYQTIFENTGNATVIFDEDTTILLANAEFEKLLHYTREETEGKKSWRDLVLEEDLERLMDYHRRRRIDPESVPQKYELKLADRHGFLHDVYMTVAMIPGTKKSVASIMDITPLKEAEKALHESETLYQTLFANAGIAIVNLDPQAYYRHVNDSYLEFIGYTWDELKDRQMTTEIVHPEYRGRIEKLIARQKSGAINGFIEEIYFLRKDGALRWGEVRSASNRDKHGRMLSVVVAITDRTERKKTEDKLKQYSEAIKDLFENAPCGYHSLAEDGTILRMNRTELAWLGYSRDEVIGKMKFTDLLPPEEQEIFRKGFSALREQGSIRNIEGKLIRKDGRELSVLIDSSVLYDKDGRYLMNRSSVFDNTERKKVENALAESETMYRSLFENASIGMFQSTLEGKFLRINKAYATMLGYESKEEVIATITDTATQIHADPRNRAELLAALEQQDWFYAEQPYLRRDGSLMIGKLAIRKVVRQDGASAYLEGIVEDITERKRAEEALINRERELRIKAQNLMEVNTTLKVLLNTLERDQEELKERFLTNIQKQVLPYLDNLKKSPLREDQLGYVEMAEAHLLEIASPFTQKLTSSFLNLTKKEIQIAYLVKEGKTSKEIAELLNAKQRVVEFHRENIRSKLGLKNKKGRLAMLLRSFS